MNNIEKEFEYERKREMAEQLRQMRKKRERDYKEKVGNLLDDLYTLK